MPHEDAAAAIGLPGPRLRTWLRPHAKVRTPFRLRHRERLVLEPGRVAPSVAPIAQYLAALVAAGQVGRNEANPGATPLWRVGQREPHALNLLDRLRLMASGGLVWGHDLAGKLPGGVVRAAISVAGPAQGPEQFGPRYWPAMHLFGPASVIAGGAGRGDRISYATAGARSPNLRTE